VKALLCCVLLAGCQATAPCSSLKCLKEGQRNALTRQCVSDMFETHHGAIVAGFYSPSDIVHVCREAARRAVR
jgi:hypothetical protein